MIVTINQIIRHEKLNLAERPCDPDPGYDFAKCVYQSIMKSVGCQPKWRKSTVPGLPNCDNISLLSRYMDEFERITNSVTNNIVKETQCLMPCTFMEYKVDIQ